MTGPEVSIIASVLGVGLGLTILLMRTTARLDRRIDNDKATADADRRALPDRGRRRPTRLAANHGRVPRGNAAPRRTTVNRRRSARYR